MDSLELSSAAIMGHSMGGYVSLAAVSKYPDKFRKLGLIHSTAYADTPEKKINRNKSIEFIEKNGPRAFFDVFVPGLYHSGGSWLEDVEKIVHATPADTLIRYTKMMRDRPERLNVLRSYPSEILFLGGEMDTFIPSASLNTQAAYAVNPNLVIMKDTGHLGMFEKTGEMLKILTAFMARS